LTVDDALAILLGMEILPAVEVGPAEEPAGSVLWLHGLGADGHDFEGLVPLLGLPRVRFVFPHAPLRGVTINGGMLMRAWYDIDRFDRGDGGEQASHVRASTELIEALLARERERGVPSERTVLAGFSQGGAMALHVGPRHPRTLGGILVLSGYEVLPETRAAEASPANRETPMLFVHGAYDDLVPVSRARRAYEAQAAAGRPVGWQEYPMGHEVCAEEVALVRDWLHQRLADSD
jgi:phospholipase/carboxylesterase